MRTTSTRTRLGVSDTFRGQVELVTVILFPGCEREDAPRMTAEHTQGGEPLII
jgi:hypothetical protein